MAAELEKLIVSLQADLKQYQKEMARAQGITTAKLRAVERSAMASAKRIESGFGRMGSSLKAGLAGLFTLGTLNQLQDMVKGVADLAEQAEIAGVSIEDLQRLKFVGISVGLDGGELVQSLAIFNKKLGGSQDKGKGLVDIFAKNGVEIENNTQAFLALGDMIKNASTAQERMVIMTAAVGKGGAKLIPLFMQGTDALKDMMGQADEAGAVIDEKLVRAADAFYDRWASRIGAWYTYLSGQVAEAGISLESLFNFDISTSDIDTILLRRDELETELKNPMRLELDLGAFNQSTAEILAAIAKIDTEIDRRRRLIEDYKPPPAGLGTGGQDAAENAQKVIDALEFERQQLQADALQQEINTQLRKADVKATSELGQQIIAETTALFNEEAAQKKSADASGLAKKKKEEQKKSYADVMEGLEQERVELVLTADELEVYNAIVKAGVAADSEAAAKIRDKTAALQAQRGAVKEQKDEAEKAAEDVEKLQEAFGTAFTDLIQSARDGKFALQELLDVLDSLAQKLIQMAAQKLFEFLLATASASFAPTVPTSTNMPIFGGAHAAGGPVSTGKSYLVGEKGPEMFQPSSSGTILPAGSFGGAAPPIINITNMPGVASSQARSSSGGHEVVDIINSVVEKRFPELLNRNAGLIGAEPHIEADLLMAAWPTTLPKCPVNRSLAWAPVPNIVETPNDVGDVIRRRRFTGTTINESGTLILTRAQMVTLFNFWAIDCAQGAVEFLMASWRDGVVRGYQFIDQPQFAAVAARFSCALSLRYTVVT